MKPTGILGIILIVAGIVLIAWGGFASVKHVTRYIQPGLELISLDPKRSATIIGRETFADEATMRDAAVRAATDVGASNQTGCSSARVILVESGCDDAGLARLRRFGEMVYEAMMRLPFFRTIVSAAARPLMERSATPSKTVRILQAKNMDGMFLS